jgi:Methyltransferase FkbM domain
VETVSKPLVSVGVLTSTSLQELDELLLLVSHQTYKNLEILVAGGLIPGPAIIHHLRGKKIGDIEVRYVPNLNQHGLEASFATMLQYASGEFFLLFGEALRREERFIERCVEEIGTHASVMSSVSVHGSCTPIPALNGDQPRRNNALEFFRSPTASILLGLHRTSWLRSFEVEMRYFAEPSLVAVESVLRSNVRVFDECLCHLEGDSGIGLALLPSWLRSGYEDLLLLSTDSKESIVRKRKLRMACISAFGKSMYSAQKSLLINDEGVSDGQALSRGSYSQSGEDMIVDFIFQALEVKYPTYLDLGAHHPTHYSNTHFFYKNGSRGVNVEADPSLLEMFSVQRAADINLNVGVGAGTAFKEGSELPFYVMSVRTLNTFSKEEAERCVAMGTHKIEDVIYVPLRDVNEIIAGYFDGDAPDFMSIDVEGMDFEIVKSINFQQYRPVVICVETIVFSENYDGVKLDEIEGYLSGVGYFLYADTRINSIFVDASRWHRC